MAAGYGTLSLIERWFEGEGFTHDPDFELPPGSQRRALVEAYESRIDWSDEAQNDRVLRVYARAIEEVGTRYGELTREADLLVRALVRDGANTDLSGNLLVPPAPAPPVAELPLDSFRRLTDPSVLKAHLRRIETGIRDDPEAQLAGR